MARTIPMILSGLLALSAIASANTHEDAIHMKDPVADADVPSLKSGAVPGTLAEYPWENCKESMFPELSGIPEVRTVAPGECVAVSAITTFRVRAPAICPDGTRAQLELYSDGFCDDEPHAPGRGRSCVEEIKDTDAGDKCFDMTAVWVSLHRKNPHFYKTSYVFSCKGHEETTGEAKEEVPLYEGMDEDADMEPEFPKDIWEDHQPGPEAFEADTEPGEGNSNEGDGEPRRGSLLELVLILCFIAAIGLLMLGAALWRFATFAAWIMNLFKPRDGAISLS